MQEICLRLKPEEFKLFRDYIQKNSGIYLNDNRSDSLKVSLCMRMQVHGLKDYGSYYQILISPEQREEEFRELLNLITINETHFFRGKSQFEALRKVVLPDIIKHKEKVNRSIRIWSAGCATGEEPYSIAIILLETLKEPETWRIEIFASDISRKALATAKKGIYSLRSLRDTDDAIIQKYFCKEDENKYILDDRVKGMVSFGYHNLAKDPYPVTPLPGGWDIIFCRNVTIYFKIESIRQVIDNFYKVLNDDGYLFIGYAEMLYQISDKFEPLELEGAFVYHKKPTRVAAKPIEKVPLVELKEIRLRERKAVRTKEEPIAKEVPAERKEEGESHYRIAYEYYKNEDFERAQLELIKALRLNPGNVQARLLLSNIYVNQERYNQAEEEIRQALDRDIFLPEAYFLLGVIFEKRGLIDKAIRELKKAIYLDKDSALAHLNLARIYKARKMTKEAVRAYQNAMRALRYKPLPEWIGPSDRFLNDALIDMCKRDIQQIKQR